MPGDDIADPLRALAGPVLAWFGRTFPGGPTPAQSLAWPAIAAGENTLLVSPTGTGKTLAAFLAIIDGLFREQAEGTLAPGVRCVYVSPLRSLGYDIERNLSVPLDVDPQATLGLEKAPGHGRASGPGTRRLISAGSSATIRPTCSSPRRKAWRLMLSQGVPGTTLWRGRPPHGRRRRSMPSRIRTNGGPTCAVSLERLAARGRSRTHARVGLSATCRPADPVARFLVGPDPETCRDRRGTADPRVLPNCQLDVDVPPQARRGGSSRPDLSSAAPEAPRGDRAFRRTTVVFANTREPSPRRSPTTSASRTRARGPTAVAAHHSALDADRRRARSRPP